MSILLTHSLLMFLNVFPLSFFFGNLTYHSRLIWKSFTKPFWNSGYKCSLSPLYFNKYCKFTYQLGSYIEYINSGGYVTTISLLKVINVMNHMSYFSYFWSKKSNFYWKYSDFEISMSFWALSWWLSGFTWNQQIYLQKELF